MAEADPCSGAPAASADSAPPMLALRRVELERQQAESRRLRSEGQRLRAELRRARPAAAIAQALHQGSCGSRPAAPLGPSEEERAGLVARQAEAQASAESLVSEAAELEERLRQRQALEAEAAVLIEALSRHGVGGGAAAEGAVVGSQGSAPPQLPPNRSAPPTAREARLTRECAELRSWITLLEGRVTATIAASQAEAGKAAAGAQGAAVGAQKGRHRGEMRRLQQLEVVARRLHEELRGGPASVRTAPTSGSSTPALGGPPHRRTAAAGGGFLPGASPGASSSACGGGVGAASSLASSARSEQLEQQMEAFCKRFAIRRGGLIGQRC